MKTEFGKYLEEFIRKNGFTAEHIAKKTNSSIAIISHYKKGIRNPKDDFIDRFISNFIKSESEKEEIRYLVAYDRTPELIRNKLKEKDDREVTEEVRKNRRVELHYLGKAAAGTGHINFENENQVIELDMLANIVPKSAYIVEVNGDSMFPTLCDGDLLIVNPNLKEKSSIAGKVCVFTYHDQTYVKRVKVEDGRIRLVSDNIDKKRYPDIVIEDENLEYLKCHGAIVESRRKHI